MFAYSFSYSNMYLLYTVLVCHYDIMTEMTVIIGVYYIFIGVY